MRGWEAGRRSTAAAAAAHCWQRENVPVISQHRYRQGGKKTGGKREEKRKGRRKEKEQSSENKPPASPISPEAGPGHVGVQSGNKGRRGELGGRRRRREGVMGGA